MPVGHEDDRPAGEGDSHTARMHVAEESDSGILPMNRPNNGEPPPAEGEEGRPLLKENTHQSRTHPTQSGARVSQRLVGVRPAEHRLAATYPREEPYALMSARTDLCGGCRATGIPTATGSNLLGGVVLAFVLDLIDLFTLMFSWEFKTAIRAQVLLGVQS
jgi:hypothetical protein